MVIRKREKWRKNENAERKRIDRARMEAETERDVYDGC